jgi:hypothetical protein
MMRLEKCEYLKNKGYTYDPETGNIYGLKGNLITRKDKQGYIKFGTTRKWRYSIYGHHFAWYIIYGNVDFEMLDHINRIKDDNRISNLRISNPSQNGLNKPAMGYCWDKERGKWRASIYLNGKYIFLGRFDNELDAKEVYENYKTKLLT